MQQLLLPLYLGKDQNSDTYYFLATKEKVGRFIKYVRYPMWCHSGDMGNFLVFEEPPQIVLQEVIAFVVGILQIEVIPKARGRAERVIKSLVSVDSPQPAFLEQNGATNVGTIPKHTSNERKKSLGAGSKTANRGAETGTFSVPEKIPGTILEHSNLITSSEKSKRGHFSEESGSVPETKTSDSNRDIPGLPGNGHANGIGRSSEPSNESNDESGRGRMLMSGILGTRGGSEGGVHGSTTDHKPGAHLGSVDGHDVPELLVKQKRKRRTKAEMLAAALV